MAIRYYSLCCPMGPRFDNNRGPYLWQLCVTSSKLCRMGFDILGEMGRACACPDVSLSFSWSWCLVRNTRPTTTFALNLRCNLLTFPSTESFGFDLKLVYKRVSKSHQSPASGVSKRTCLQFQCIQQGSNGYSDKYFLVRFCCASNNCVIFRL